MKKKESLMPNYFGEKFVMEECSTISISDTLEQFKKHLKQVFFRNNIEFSGIQVKTTTTTLASGGIRYWFICPACNKRKFKLICTPSGLVGCNSCLPVTYSKRRYKGMAEDDLFKQ